MNVCPLTDLAAIETALTHTSEMRAILDAGEAIPIDGISDIRPQISKAELEGSQLEAEELVEIMATLSVARRLQIFFSKRGDKIKSLTSVLVPLEHIEKEINRCIDPAECTIHDRASPALSGIRKRITAARDAVRRKIEHLMKNLGAQGMLQENVITVRNGRLVLMVKEEFRRHLKGLVHDQSASGSSLFIEPIETLEDNNRVRELLIEERAEIARILRALTDLVRQHIDSMKSNISLLAQLDFIHAKAHFSKLLKACF